jgi:NADH-ubiquinone oxidoreductase chain 5
MTCLFAGTIGLVQNDLKRIIAYSTCSQLGYMVTACGASNYSVGIFHLFNHAFFKALLFLSAGAMIHALANEQDIRKYGGFQKILLFSYTLILIGSLALIGTPFLTGFYSKDVILELAGARYSLSVHFSYLLASFSVLTTSYYSWRLIWFCFHTNQNKFQLGRLSNTQKQTIQHAHDADWVMALPLIILALGSIYGGFLFKSMFIGLGTDFWNNAIYVKPSHSHLIEAEFLHQGLKLLPIGLTISGGVLAYIFSLVMVEKSYANASGWLRQLYMMLNRRWLYDKLLNDLFGMPSYKLGYHMLMVFDKGLLELLPFAPLGLNGNFKTFTVKLGQTQSGLIFHYASIMITASVCFFAFLAYPDQLLIMDSRMIGLMFLALITAI